MTSSGPASLALHVALPVPLPHGFDYAVPTGAAVDSGWIGCRVRVPLGPRQMIGVVVDVRPVPDTQALRRIEARLDATPILGGELLRSLTWAAQYYQHPLGEVLATALPAWFRRRRQAPRRTPTAFELTTVGRAALAARPPRAGCAAAGLQLALTEGARPRSAVATSPAAIRTLRLWLRQGWIAECEAPVADTVASRGPELNAAQRNAIDHIQSGAGFRTVVLDGVTGSGKTEVYLRLIAAELAAGRQSLVLVPEIGLTPQLLERLESRLGVPVGVLHSGLAAGARAGVWQDAAQGRLRVVLGTRSAVFVPLRDPGLIVIDEEHDSSFKQQDGFRYHARDLALVRAQAMGIPIVLGSATPALETLANVAQGRYGRMRLPERAGGARPPAVQVLDLCGQALPDGLLERTRAALRACLARGEQALVFRNQRGYAPVLLCHDCGWFPACPRCSTRATDARALTWHRVAGRMRCHHCGLGQSAPTNCAQCGSLALAATGFGTQRLEQTLAQAFPEARIVRADADSARGPGGLSALLDPLAEGGPALLVGTQMLAKGHDLPRLTLAVVLGVDAALMAADFRAPERFAQLLVQVSGRVGRSDRAGQVLIQTHQARHPLLRQILDGGYEAFATTELELRRAANLPPFAAQALLRAEARSAEVVGNYLDAAVAAFDADQPADPTRNPVARVGPLPAPQPRRAGYVRGQVLLESPRRADLHARLQLWVPRLHALPSARQVRWSLDVDPIDSI